MADANNYDFLYFTLTNAAYLRWRLAKPRIGYNHLRILYVLYTTDRYFTVNALKKLHVTSKKTVHRVMERLTASDLIIPRPMGAHTAYRITPTGRARMSELMQAAQEQHHYTLEAIQALIDGRTRTPKHIHKKRPKTRHLPGPAPAPPPPPTPRPAALAGKSFKDRLKGGH